MSLLPACFALICLCASAPPAWFPGAEFLVLVGWALFFGILRDAEIRRPLRLGYLVGVGHMLWFSFSVRHVLFPAWLAIGMVGGLYYVLCLAWARALWRWLPGSLSCGLALAGVHFCRAHCPEIHYPHGQPIHALWSWPELLAPLGLGSELLGNLLLGCLAGALVDLHQAWRQARPSLGRARWQLGLVLVSWPLAGWLRPALPPSTETVRVALIEPGMSLDRWFQIDEQGYYDLLTKVMIPQSEALAGPGVAEPPALLLWPESLFLHRAYPSPQGQMRLAPLLPPRMAPRLHPQTRLMTGTTWELDSDRRKIIALLTDARGRYAGHGEKQRLVPGGERAPFLDYLPASWADWLRAWFEAGMGQPLPDHDEGGETPLLETAAGQRFGAMICYDNAFPEVAQALAAQGAGFLVVLSNENWYRRGGELDQMLAMSVCRCLETGLAMVRCTVDGPSVLVTGRGEVQAMLPWKGVQGPDRARNLRLDVPVRAGQVVALPWLRPGLVWLVLCSALALFLPQRQTWGRLGQEQDPRSGDPAPHITS